MVVVIGPLSGGHTHKTADRPIIPSSLTPPLNIVHRIFSLDRLPAVLLLPASKAARPSPSPRASVTWTATARRFFFFIELACVAPFGVCSATRSTCHEVCMYLSTDGMSQATNPSSKQCQESSNQRPSPSASPSAPVPAVSWSAQRQPHVFLHTLHCSRPRRPQTVAECPLELLALRVTEHPPGVCLLACIALQLDQDSSRSLAPLWRLLPGEVVFSRCPAGSVLRAREACMAKR